MIKKHLGFLINLVAIALFIPGIFLPMFSLNMAMTANVSGAKVTNIQVYIAYPSLHKKAYQA